MLVFLAEQLGDERELILNAEEYPYRLFSYHYSSNLAEEVVLRALNGEDPVKRPRKVKEVPADTDDPESRKDCLGILTMPIEKSAPKQREPRKPKESKPKSEKPAKQNAAGSPKKKKLIG